MTRRNFTPDFKAKVALEAIKNDKTLAEIASKHQIHPMLIAKWKRTAIEDLVNIFEDGRKRKTCIDHEAEKQILYEEIGRLKVQLDWVKKKSGIDN